MAKRSNAEKLEIGDDDLVWVVGTIVEGTGLLDPLPEGAETTEERVPGLNATIVVVDSPDSLAEQLDEVLPQIGSIPVAWVAFPRRGLAPDAVGDAVEDYGWDVVGSEKLDETWTAVRISPA